MYPPSKTGVPTKSIRPLRFLGKHLLIYLLTSVLAAFLVLFFYSLLLAKPLEIFLAILLLPFSIPFAIIVTFIPYLITFTLLKALRFRSKLAFIAAGLVCMAPIFLTKMPDIYNWRQIALILSFILSAICCGLFYEFMDRKIKFDRVKASGEPHGE